MSSPSLPIVPQWLNIAISVNQALGTKQKLKWANLEFSPYVVKRGKVASPFSDLPAQIIRPANEKMSYDRASGILVFPRDIRRHYICPSGAKMKMNKSCLITTILLCNVMSDNTTRH